MINDNIRIEYTNSSLGVPIPLYLSRRVWSLLSSAIYSKFQISLKLFKNHY